MTLTAHRVLTYKFFFLSDILLLILVVVLVSTSTSSRSSISSRGVERIETSIVEYRGEERIEE
jgi:hypothetical protein